MVFDNGFDFVVVLYVMVQCLVDEFFYILNIDYYVFFQCCICFLGLMRKFNIKYDGLIQIIKRNGLLFGIFLRYGNWIIKNYVYQVLLKEINK